MFFSFTNLQKVNNTCTKSNVCAVFLRRVRLKRFANNFRITFASKFKPCRYFFKLIILTYSQIIFLTSKFKMAANIQYGVKLVLIIFYFFIFQPSSKWLMHFFYADSWILVVILFCNQSFFCLSQIRRKYPKWRPKQEKSSFCPQLAKF
jgi:hypothetical protein